MKVAQRCIFQTQLVSGELYLFHKTDSSCPADSSVWGVFDKSYRGEVYLESYTMDLCRFDMWRVLPTSYLYCRPAVNSEVRDYFFNFGYTTRHDKPYRIRCQHYVAPEPPKIEVATAVATGKRGKKK